MADSAQAKSTIQITTALSTSPETHDILLPTGILGQETISRPYAYNLTLLSKDFAIAPGKLLGTAVGVRIKHANRDQFRGLHGVVAAFSGGALHPKRPEYRTYTMRVVPWFALLDHGEQFRVFQDKDVLQIIDAVLTQATKDMHGGQLFSIRVQSSPRYPVLQFCAQYGETDFNFVSRLMEQHGLHYFFDQTDSSHMLVIVDGPPYKVCEESPVSFVASLDSRGVVDNWTHSYAPPLRKWTVRDREYRLNPPVTEKAEATVVTGAGTAVAGEQASYPGGFAVLAAPGERAAYADLLARTRMQEAEAMFEVFNGNTRRASLSAGQRLKVIGVGNQPSDERIKSEEEIEYLVTSVNFTATEGAYTEDTAGEIVLTLLHDSLVGGTSVATDKLKDAGKDNLPKVNQAVDKLPTVGELGRLFGVGFAGFGVSLALDLLKPVLHNVPIIGILFPKPKKPPPYTNSFTGVPIVEGRQYRSPSITPKPRVRGPQTAVVWGQDEHDVATDELGRVRVKFDWDPTAKGGEDAETNSCWVRVVQGWAGSRRGSQFLPRVGDEVVVEFIDGDPDRPLVTGRVYDATHKPPFDLPKYRLQSGIKTRSVPLGDSAKDRYHMLRFDDTANHEQVLLRSQARLDVRAFGSAYETTGGSRFAHIGYKNDKEGDGGGDYDITVGNDYQLHINGGHYQRVEKALNLTVVGQAVHDMQADAAWMVKGKASVNAGTIILEAKQKISLKVGGNAIVIDPAGVTIIGTLVKINSGGQGAEAGDADIEDPVDAAVSDTGEPGWLEKHKGGKGGGRRKRHLSAQHFIAPPRPGESPQMTALRNRLNQTPTGRNAVNVFDRDNVTFAAGPGQGATYNAATNTVTLDPNSPTAASTMVHEMNHADAHHSGLSPDRATMSRQDYVNAQMAEDAHGEVLAQKEANELSAIGQPEAGNGNPFTRGVYNAAAQQGAADYRAAHPDATQDEVDAAGERAGEARVNQSYQDGNVRTGNTTPPQTYNDYWGQDWDRGHPAHP